MNYGAGISNLNSLQLFPIPPKNRKQITLSIRYELINRIKPMRAYLKVPCAFLTFSGLPNEVKYLKAPTTNMINNTKIIRDEDINRIFPNTTSRHLKVGMPSGVTQLPHALIPWAYTAK